MDLGVLEMVLLVVVLTILGMSLLYFVVRWGVRDGMQDAHRAEEKERSDRRFREARAKSRAHVADDE